MPSFSCLPAPVSSSHTPSPSSFWISRTIFYVYLMRVLRMDIADPLVFMCFRTTKNVKDDDMRSMPIPDICLKTSISFRFVLSKPGVSIRCTIYRCLYTKVYSLTSAVP